MIKLLSDENFDGAILRGLLRQFPAADFVRVQDVGLAQAKDPLILAWAAKENRILLTHDRETMPGFAFERMARGESMPGIFLFNDPMSKGKAIEQLILAIQCLEPEECRDRVFHFPL